ncbi:MAG TPA: hypothetical protein DCX07_06885, partial [Phycisphaerales bacterium]|nr:hypothetical protein [Phycisphaerales bacterium]
MQCQGTDSRLAPHDCETGNFGVYREANGNHGSRPTAVMEQLEPRLLLSSVVFQADFNGNGTGEGWQSDIVTFGGTGSLTDASVIGTSPLSRGNYLNVVDSGAGAGYATFSP